MVVLGIKFDQTTQTENLPLPSLLNKLLQRSVNGFPLCLKAAEFLGLTQKSLID